MAAGQVAAAGPEAEAVAAAALARVAALAKAAAAGGWPQERSTVYPYWVFFFSFLQVAP